MQRYTIDPSLNPRPARGMRPFPLVAAVLYACISGCGHRVTPYVARVRETRGVLISVAAWGRDSQRLDHAVTAALDSAAAVETALAGVGDRPGTQGVAPGLAQLVLRAVELARASGGAFDPTTRNLRALSVDTVRHTITLAGRLHLDLGEVGRGYALDRALAALHGVADSAVISSGGQNLIHSDWSGARVVGIVDPNHTLAPLATLTIPAGTWAVSTMSVAEAGDEVHDPRTGKPATRTRVVAAMAASAATAGGWSAAFYVVGCDSALALAPRVHMSVVCVDDDVRWSSDLEGRVTLLDSLRER
jgi:thiamine biosynthesis lipoprotein ApbE